MIKILCIFRHSSHYYGNCKGGLKDAYYALRFKCKRCLKENVKTKIKTWA